MPRWPAAAAGGLLLLLVLWRLGTGAAVAGLRAVDLTAVTAAVAVTVLVTLCCAWRWQTVARELHVELPLAEAVSAYYRSTFLNVALPGGVAGDVERGLRHGRRAHQRARCLRAVLWERATGQAVLAFLTACVLLATPLVPRAGTAGLLGCCLLGAAVLLRRRRGPLAASAGSVRVSVRVVSDEVRALLRRRTATAIVTASALAVVGHVTVFVVAARSVGVTAPYPTLVPLALLTLVAAAVPVSLAGWGPREGAAAWAFASAGLGAEQGLATSVAYGVLVLAASAPGALLLLVHTRAPEVVPRA